MVEIYSVAGSIPGIREIRWFWTIFVDFWRYYPMILEIQGPVSGTIFDAFAMGATFFLFRKVSKTVISKVFWRCLCLWGVWTVLNCSLFCCFLIIWGRFYSKDSFLWALQFFEVEVEVPKIYSLLFPLEKQSFWFFEFLKTTSLKKHYFEPFSACTNGECNKMCSPKRFENTRDLPKSLILNDFRWFLKVLPYDFGNSGTGFWDIF